MDVALIRLVGMWSQQSQYIISCATLYSHLPTGSRLNVNRRVWSQQTKRMIHQLAGHSQKITCVRLFPGEKSIITGSADRSIRVWDISRHVYKQTVTFRHSSTTNCSDVSYEQSVVSGHLDGG